MDKKSKNMFKSSVAIKIVSVALSFINTIIINRTLGIELRGEYAFIINSANMLQLILNLGIGYSYPYFVKRKYDNIKDIFSTIILIQVIIYMLLFGIAISLTNDIGIKLILGLSIVLTLNLQVLFITMIEDIIGRNKILLLSAVIYTIALGISSFLFSINLEIIIYITGFKYLLEIFVLMNKFKLYKLDIKIINVKIIKEILKVGTPTMIMTLLITFNYNIDVIIMKSITSNYEVGIYGVAVALANMVWIIPDAFKEVIFNKSSKENCSTDIIHSIFINCVICIIITIGFVVLGKRFLNIVYGSEYIECYKIVITLFIGTIPMIFFKLIHPLYVSNGKQNILMIILLVSAIINVVLNFITIPKLGAYGAAISSVVSYLVCGAIFVIMFKKDYKIDFTKYIKNIENSF